MEELSIIHSKMNTMMSYINTYMNKFREQEFKAILGIKNRSMNRSKSKKISNKVTQTMKAYRMISNLRNYSFCMK